MYVACSAYKEQSWRRSIPLIAASVRIGIFGSFNSTGETGGGTAARELKACRNLPLCGVIGGLIRMLKWRKAWIRSGCCISNKGERRRILIGVACPRLRDAGPYLSVGVAVLIV